MRSEGRLTIAGGFASETGRRAANEDFCALYIGTATEQATHGMLAAVADGVSAGGHGREAAELAVRSLVDGFYACPETIGPARSAERVLGAYNSWLYGQRHTESLRDAATTLTAAILKGRRAHILHIGDSRAWLLRDGRFRQLTRDHVRSEPDLRHVLIRGIGIEPAMRLDHVAIDLAEHDRLLLTSDGVHESLAEMRLGELLGARNAAQRDSEVIVEAAFKAGSRDNATAVIIDIVGLPAPDHQGVAEELAALPILAVPDVGDSVDGYQLEEQLASGRYTALFRATDGENGGTVAVKFPKPAILSERSARLAFAREILIGQRVHSPFVGEAFPVSPERQTRLYSIQPFYAGETMIARLKRGLQPMAESIEAAVGLTRAVAALHRLDIVHRDIKPDNVILSEGGLKLVDLGVARLPRIEDFHGDEIPGTPGHMAPEQFAGNAGDVLTDQFALGVTLYRWFTGKWPFGEQEAFSRPRFADPAPPSRHRPEIPAWLDAAILRAIARNSEDRFGDVIELLRALEGGGSVERIPPRRFVPLIERNPVRFWQVTSVLLAIALIVAIAAR
ncbi:bifunctional protein-serine/threonine kinase/phosphatase [Parasphingopyxis marina]|uniref:Bifunctional protein-serine/threonine kinase/phosphatase n=1 Tax=Parasphingopyxis marina TaxID=2761622 RepID=A0A842I1L0_9SPHN|nr:bifunctional protein-serine/threonine kinase/phosphatase [Parasphingopyxis marina]MBC2779142.1 bifunctional protein-serine/threonine kinase/phosphatase [Parasphingopyxis marina]